MKLDTALSLLAQDPQASIDLAEVALRIAGDEYHQLDVEGYLAEMDSWARELAPQLRGSLPQRVENLCRYLFAELGFAGNQKAYHDPRNSYLNEVLDRRLGLPITLSLVTRTVGQKAGLNIEGIGLPGHFIVRAVEGEEEILFDPFHLGRLLNREECAQVVAQATGREITLAPHAFASISPGPWVLRMLLNLKSAYLLRGDHGRAARIIARLRQIAPHDPGHLREEGIALVRASRPGRALESLQEYLRRVPMAPDAGEVRQLIQRALSDLASWN